MNNSTHIINQVVADPRFSGLEVTDSVGDGAATAGAFDSDPVFARSGRFRGLFCACHHPLTQAILGKGSFGRGGSEQLAQKRAKQGAESL